jgi:ankyrin repeat protein
MLASLFGHRDLVTLLMQKGADPNVVDAKGRTALAMASRAGKGEIVQILKQHGATK